MSVALPLVVIALLVLANGLFVAAEFAIVASRRSRVERLAREGRPVAARVGRVLGSVGGMDRYIAAAQLGITLASIGLGMYGERSIAGWLYGPLERFGGLGEPAAHTVGTVLAVALLTYVHVVLGEMVPKALALQAPEETALRVSRSMQLFSRLFAPVVWVLNGVATLFLRLFRVPVAGHGSVYTVTELEQLVEESFEEGQVAERQHELLDNIFAFGERTARQLMTPRVQVMGAPLDLAGEPLLDFVERGPHSRYPVYRGDLDDIVGVLHVKDVIHAWSRGEEVSAGRLMHRAPRVPEAVPAETLLDALKRRRLHMAIVMNEHGGTAGVVTLEDLLETVVGDVQDEFDHEEPAVREIGPGLLSLRGEVLIDELNERCGLDLRSATAETVAGLVVDELGRPPAVGDRVERGGAGFEVEEVRGLAITRLRVTLPADDEEGDAPPA